MSESHGTHLNDTPLGSGFRFLTEIIAWITGTWAASLFHPILGVAALIVMIGLPTVFTTKGDKKHTMINTPGQLRAMIDFSNLLSRRLLPGLYYPFGFLWFALLSSSLPSSLVAHASFGFLAALLRAIDVAVGPKPDLRKQYDAAASRQTFPTITSFHAHHY